MDSRLGGSQAQVRREHGACTLPIWRGNVTSHDMYGACARLGTVLDTLIEGGLKIALTSGQGSEPSLAPGRLAGGCVDTQQGELTAARDRGDLRRRHLVRKVHFNGAEAGASRRIESLRQRSISPEQADIGGKTRQSHGSFAMMGSIMDGFSWIWAYDRAG
jgi:hypothetical protein